MADPLCLPNTTSGWEEMRKLITDCIESNLGPIASNLVIREKEDTDSVAFFETSAFSKYTGIAIKISGKIEASWNKDGMTFLNLVFDNMKHIPIHIWLAFHEWDAQV